ncbi:MAG: aspartate--tRNA ligase [Bacteroidota bacterium]|nr:aspartate--tRNA ligase [Bacteroidota bacterium]
MYRTHYCGELNIENVGQTVTLAGWVKSNRKFGGATFIDLRDRYGITQLVFDMETDASLCQQANELGREYVVQAVGKVTERSNKNTEIPTGEIEIVVITMTILNVSPTPPFTIEDNTDGGEELRMKYRYLDLRRNIMQKSLMLRHKLAEASREYLSRNGFIEIETPFLIKSTPEGARDFIVPSRIHQGEWYALPQSPQTFKQILMMSGYDKYFQIVKCFRDEDFRADRQPEFTQVDCEMSFVHQADIIAMFTGYAKHVFEKVINVDLGDIPTITYTEAMLHYGSDKPDLRFEMKLNYLNELVVDNSFPPFAEATSTNGSVISLAVSGGATYTRKQIDAYTDFVKQPNRALSGLIWAKWNEDDTVTSSVGKFFQNDEIYRWFEASNAGKGDLLLIAVAATRKVQKAMGDLRLEVAKDQNLRDKNVYKALWVIDFPMFSYDEGNESWTFEHHPFTSPKSEHIDLLQTEKGAVLANAYDFVINGWECCSGSIRIHDPIIQSAVFEALGMSKDEAQTKFGFLLGALTFGAPPHGGCAFGFDRLAALMMGTDSIRDVIAFPKNNSGRDLMLDAPAAVDFNVLKSVGLA